MIHFVRSDEASKLPILMKTMFLDRAEQFSRRLKWDVSVDSNGEERDEYDALNPIYIIVEDENGEHEGSMRFLPTIGRTMVNDHFRHLSDGRRIVSPSIWECTRFCCGKRATRKTASKLLSAGGKLMREFAIDRLVAVFDGHMERVYRMSGSSPKVVARKTIDGSVIGVGLWSFDSASYRDLLKRAGVTVEEMELYFANSSLLENRLEVVA